MSKPELDIEAMISFTESLADGGVELHLCAADVNKLEEFAGLLRAYVRQQNTDDARAAQDMAHKPPEGYGLGEHAHTEESSRVLNRAMREAWGDGAEGLTVVNGQRQSEWAFATAEQLSRSWPKRNIEKWYGAVARLMLAENAALDGPSGDTEEEFLAYIERLLNNEDLESE